MFSVNHSCDMFIKNVFPKKDRELIIPFCTVVDITLMFTANKKSSTEY